MKVLTCAQGSPEWFAARAGVLTASVAGDIYSVKKETAAARDLRMRLALERVTGRALEDTSYTNADMERGKRLEPEARAAYEMSRGVAVQEVGFIVTDCGRFGASPDGLVGDDGLIEIKCPRPAIHFQTARSGKVPADYVPQVLHALMVTERTWADFISYCPQLPAPLDLIVIRVEGSVASHALEATKFMESVKTEADAIRTELHLTRQLAASV